MTEDTRRETRSGLERLMGGRPGGVVIKLLLLSLVVGFVMSVFGFNAGDLIRGGISAFREAFRDGAGLIRQLGGYVLAGAAIVLPIWLLLRVTRSR